MAITAVQRNAAAADRAASARRNALLRDGAFHVKSERTPGKTFLVEPEVIGDRIRFTCHPTGVGAYIDDHRTCIADPGVCGCKHAARAAGYLRRHGLARLVDGYWTVTPKVDEYQPEPASEPCDPFEGLV